MSIELPEPSPTEDVWGTELNTAIESIKSIADAAATAAASNVSVTDEDASGNPIINYGSTSAAVLLASARGVADGVASLDNGGKVPLAQLSNLGYADVGAASALHTHALSDLPQVALAVNASPAIAVFNNTTHQWPRRIDITSSLTRTVIWWGDAVIPTDAIPNVDIYFGPKTSGATVPDPTPTPTPTPTPDVNLITLSVPTVTVNGSLYNISATCTVTGAKTFAYLQLAVRGPGAVSQDTGYNSNVTIPAGGSLTLSGSGTATAVGTWTVFAAYNLTGGTNQSDWINGPAQTFTIATIGGGGGTPGTGTPGSGSVPLIGRSGLSWNSGVCDRSNGSITECTAFFNWRGRPGDSIMFFPGRGTTGEMMWMPDGLTTFPGYRVISLPSQPQPQQNSVAAAGSMNSFWQSYGAALVAKGWNDGRTILRLNWECNGNWYAWSWMNGGAATFVNAWKNVVNSIRAGGADKTKFDLCMNRGNVNGGVTWQTQIMDPLIGYVDLVGLDWYDFAPAQTNDSAFNSAAAQDPGGNSIATYCRAKGLKMTIDEWGVCTSGVGGFSGGNDSPYWIGKMFDWMYANRDVLVHETYFNVNADGLYQQLYPVDTKPNSSAAYRASNHWGV